MSEKEKKSVRCTERNKTLEIVAKRKEKMKKTFSKKWFGGLVIAVLAMMMLLVNPGEASAHTNACQVPFSLRVPPNYSLTIPGNVYDLDMETGCQNEEWTVNLDGGQEKVYVEDSGDLPHNIYINFGNEARTAEITTGACQTDLEVKYCPAL